jgi:hypothetical protein
MKSPEQGLHQRYPLPFTKADRNVWLQGTPCESASDPDITLSAGLTGFRSLAWRSRAVSLVQQPARCRATFRVPVIEAVIPEHLSCIAPI